MPWMPGCPRTDDDNGHGAGGGVQCGIMHMTYGSWSGDVATVINGGLCTWVVGKEQGQWLQLMDSDSISYNVGNWSCNQHSVAIEFTGVNEDVLTDWQVECGAKIVQWVRDVHHVEIKYDDGADGANDTAPWSGWYAHRAVMPDSGSQHSDFIDRSEWDRITGGEEEVTQEQMDIIGQWMKQQRELLEKTLGQWFKDTEGRINAHVDAKVANLPTGGGVGEDRVRAIFREELDKTHLAG